MIYVRAGSGKSANLTPWYPFRDTLSLRDAMDRLFEDSFVRPRSWLALTIGDGTATLALDVHESDNDLTVRASFPGVKPEDVDISITGDTLTIKGETREEKEKKTGSYHVRERRYGAFQRSNTLPTQMNADKANAEFVNEVLTLSRASRLDCTSRR